jgi:hypothetical protein
VWAMSVTLSQNSVYRSRSTEVFSSFARATLAAAG